jgi:hypothetical protein
LENNAPLSTSLLQQVGDEINSTAAGRVVSNMAKMATNKMSELLGIYSILILLSISLFFQ